MSLLEGRTVLITGAGGGFGREMIRQFLQAGSYLVLSDCELAPVYAAITSAVASGVSLRGRVLTTVVADLASDSGCESLFQAATPHQIDVLVNNAGIALCGHFAEVPLPEWERLMQINLLAPMRLTARFLPGMLERGSGHIVNISSAAGLVGTAGLSTYSAAKFGLRGFGEALADELAPSGVRVSNVYPFFSRTPILDSPRFGQWNPAALPDRMISNPVHVVAAIIRGIQTNQVHIYPDPISRQIALIQRLGPGMLATLRRFTRM